MQDQVLMDDVKAELGSTRRLMQATSGQCQGRAVMPPLRRRASWRSATRS